MTTKFKVGDRIRNVSDVAASIPTGYEVVVQEVDSDDWPIFLDAEGDRRCRPYKSYELVTETPTFDATKLRKGDKVVAIVNVNLDGLDGDGDINTLEAYLKPDQILGYAPGYTPAAAVPLKIGDMVLHANTGDHGKPGEIVWLDDAYATVRWPASGVSTYPLPAIRRAA